MTLHDQIVLSIAEAFGFTCSKQEGFTSYGGGGGGGSGRTTVLSAGGGGGGGVGGAAGGQANAMSVGAVGATTVKPHASVGTMGGTHAGIIPKGIPGSGGGGGGHSSAGYAFNSYYVLHKECDVQSPPINHGPNPCSEIPLKRFELSVAIDGNVLIINRALKFDLNKPNSIDKIFAEFSDLNRLRQNIWQVLNRHRTNPCNEVVL